MRRALVAILVLTAFAAVPPAGAAAGTGVAGTATVTTPKVGFDPLVTPWWIRRVAQETGDRRTLTALYLADGGTARTGRGFALVRTYAVAGAELCGASPTSLSVAAGPFARADLLQSGDTLVLRRTGARPGAPVTMLVARGLTPTEVQEIVSQLRIVRGVLAPRTFPNDLHLAGLAPVDATLTSGPGTVLDVVGGISSERTVALHASVVRGAAKIVARFFRATSVGMACTPDRYRLTDHGDAVVAATSSLPGDAEAVARMVRRVDAAGYAKIVGWAQRPDVTQLARRCKGLPGMVTIAAENHRQVWGVGLTAAVDGATCTAGRSGGAGSPGAASGAGPVRVRLRRHDTCGVLLVAGNAPPKTRRLVIRSGRSTPQHGHLRLVRGPAGSTALWAALVRTPAITEPPVTVTAYDRRQKVLGRVQVPAGSKTACRVGRRV